MIYIFANVFNICLNKRQLDSFISFWNVFFCSSKYIQRSTPCLNTLNI